MIEINKKLQAQFDKMHKSKIGEELEKMLS